MTRNLSEPPDPDMSALDSLKTAVSYPRVSTKEQAEKDGEPDGYSLPAQRDANRRKAASLGAVIVKEFVERGESAKTSDRPKLQEMLAYIKERRVDYVIVHNVDRLARNRADDVQIHMAIRAAGAELVSATVPRTSTSPRVACFCMASCPRSQSSIHAALPLKSSRV